MLDQEDDPELDDEWLTANEQLTRFRKFREQIVGRVTGTELPSVQGPQSHVFLIILGSLNRWRFCSFDPPYNFLSRFAKTC